MVVEFEKRRKPSKHYVYVINVTWSDKSVVVIFRRYSKFFELQTRLFEDFPDEGGVKDPSKRSLPFLPGKIIFGRSNTRDVAEKRKEPINDYCQSLIKLPGKISASDLVLEFFEPTNEDISPGEGEEQKDKKKAKDEIAQVISEPIQLEQYIVIADYQKQNRSEVSVLAGDIVEVIDKNENGWWFVNMDEEQGWLPASYLEPEDGSAESIVGKTYKVGDEKYIATRAYTANEPDEIGFQKGVVVDILQKNVDGWWLIRFNGKDGWAPSIYLKKVDPSQALPRAHGYENVNLENEPVVPRKPQRQRKENEGDQSSKLPPRKSSVRKSHKVKNRVRTPASLDGKASLSSLNDAEYVALSEYRALGMSGRLSVQVGVSVQIIEKSPNGWWYCRIGNEEGWIPSSHLNRQEKKSKPELVATKSPAVAPRPGASSEVEYVAISDYTDNDRLNVSLKKGALVKVLEKNDSGWWYVESSGAEGWAPSTFLKEKPKEKPKQKPKPPPKVNVPRSSPRPALRSHGSRPVPPTRPSNTRAGQQKDGGKMSPVPPIPNRVNKPLLKDAKDPSRTQGKSSGSVESLLEKALLKPAVPLQQARSDNDISSGVHQGSRGREGQRGAARPNSGEYYVAVADYNDESDDTLDLKWGDRVKVLQRDEGGWWRAVVGNRTGWVPANYLEK